MKKIQENIIKLELNNATYKKKPITINPTLINFFMVIMEVVNLQ